jgi:hypothetical protein
MKRLTILILLLFVCLSSMLGIGTRTAKTQSQIANGRFIAPSIGSVLQPLIPISINWTVANPVEISSQDLILSTDGGVTFKIKIAAHLPPEQRQLNWGTAPGNATGRAKLELALHLRTGVIEQVLSDDFSIAPFPGLENQTASTTADENLSISAAKMDTTSANSSLNDTENPNTSSAQKGAASGSAKVSPAFANPGSCTTAETPVLNYNMNHPTQCASFYNGEPALAQDPTDPTRFFAATGLIAQTSSTAQWAFSGSSTTSSLDFGNQLASRGDLTVEVGADGTVYVAGLAQPQGATLPDRILIFRSKNHGATFETGVAVPNVPTGQFVDKPVLAVNPLDSETLVITFNLPSVFPGTHLAICKQASTGSLSDPNIWGVSNPKDDNGFDLSTAGTTHPLIDPINSTTYRLFVVQTNDTVTQFEAGYAIYQYQLSAGQLTVSNANLKRILPAEVMVNGSPVGAPRWNANSSHQAIEDALRVSSGSNFTKAAIDYCDPNAHRMYIPTLVDTSNNPNFPDGGLTSDLFLSVWQYTGTESVTTKRILPGEKEKYVACAVTDGHGRVWVDAFIIASDPNNPQNMDNQRAQKGVIALSRTTGDPGAVAYMSVRLPAVIPNPNLFFGDYIYTQAAFYPDPNNPGNANGLGSRVASPTFTDTLYLCSSAYFEIEVSGWN